MLSIRSVAGSLRSLRKRPAAGSGVTLTLMGTITSAHSWNLSYSGGTLYAMSQSAEPSGTGTVYRSTNEGVSWTTGASMTGTNSAYGFAILALSSSTVIVQHRATFFRSTNSGASFTNILNATSGGQNNFYNISSDGTYGICAGYDQEVITTNNWSSCSTQGKPQGFVMASAALTNNGGNKFIRGGLGSSGSPYKGWVTNYNFTDATTSFNFDNNQILCASNRKTGFNCFATDAANLQILYATYPSTSYTTAITTGITPGMNNKPAITYNNKILLPMNTGLYLLDGVSSPILVSSLTDFSAVESNPDGDAYAIRTGGEVYKIIQ